MPYEPNPAVGTILQAEKNTEYVNPGPTHNTGDMDPWLQAQAKDKAYQDNLDLIEEWSNAKRDNPAGSAYPTQLGNNASWAVVVITAEAGGIAYDRQRVGPAVKTLTVT
jgi:hypothetical protein